MGEPVSPAEVYEHQFVPALFRQWGPIVSEAASLGEGDRVLDVACGTGALALAAAERVLPAGRSSASIRTRACSRWRADTTPRSSGAPAVPNRCPLPMDASTRS